jgi:heat shock protein beta
LEKARFHSVQDESFLGDTKDLEVKIEHDPDAKTISIIDTGVGMTKKDLQQNLGVVARSGTSRFLEAMGSKGGDDSLQLIGQFGVGFYSAYLVADRVTVTSKANGDDQHIWTSKADGAFTVVKDPRGNTLGRGTAVTLHLKQDATEFLQTAEIESVVQRYSEFMDFPIYLKVEKTVTEEVPVEDDDEDEEVAEESNEDDDELDATEEDDEEEQAPKTKTVTKTVEEYKRLNEHKPLWTRNKNDISEEDYNEFFKAAIDKTQTEAPFARSHFKAEGEVEFNSLLFIPSKAEQGLYDNYYTKQAQLKLYVRRVLVADKFEEFMPRYLNFVKGLVDSNDLPLNVNREQLQKSKVLKVIGKKVTRKALDMLRKLAEEEEDDEDEDDEDDEESTTDGEESDESTDDDSEEEISTFTKFWEQYGKSIKLGIMEDQKNKQKLAKLLRFKTTTSGDKWVSLDQYLANNDETKSIYFIAGQSEDQIKASPFLEPFAAKNIEVLLFTDTLDEYFTQHLSEYEGVKFQSISKEGIDLADTKNSKSATKHFEKVEEDFKPLTDFLKETLGKKVAKVVIAKNAMQSPVVISTGGYGWSANMERIVKAQAFQNNNGMASVMKSQKTMELNYRHPTIKALLAKVQDDAESTTTHDLAELLFDSALLQSGFVAEDAATFATRIQRLVSSGLNVDPKAELDAEPEFVDEEEDEDENEDEAEDEAEDLDEDVAEDSTHDEL